MRVPGPQLGCLAPKLELRQMQPLQAVGALHALILIALTWRATRHLVANILTRLCASFVLVWCNLILTALILSLFSALDRSELYFSVSLGLAAALVITLQARGIVPYPVEDQPGAVKFQPVDRALSTVLGVVMGLAILGTALICVRYVPNNWDTCTYRLSRAFFYLAHGNLLHPGNPPDPRISFYPFNGALVDLFLAIYRFPARWFNVIPAVSWLFAGIATYAAARAIGASPTGSRVAAVVCLITPNILVQGASGNDEVLAATPILIGLIFAWFWVSTSRLRYALLAGISLGIGLGTKLHWGFYWLTVCAGAVWLTFRLFRTTDARRILAQRIPGIVGASIIVAPLAGSFVVCNYISTRTISDAAFNNQVLNTPFRLSLAKEKIQTSSGEMLLSPIPDLVPPVHPVERQAAYSAFNGFFMKCCFSNLAETTKRSPEGYMFIGPADQLGFQPAETTVWMGFLPHFFILVFLVYAIARKLPLAPIVLIGAFLLWHLTYAAQTRYIWWACTYYAFPAVISVAALGPVWDFARHSRGASARLLLAGLAALLASHILLAGNLLVFGSLRNIQFVWRHSPPPEMHPVDHSVSSAIAAARKIYIPATHWEVLYWNFMRFNPAAKYSTGGSTSLASPDVLMLLSIPPDLATGRDSLGNTATGYVPVRLPKRSVPALTFVGDADHDHVFAQGDGIELRYPERAHYTLLTITWRHDPATGAPLGAQASDCCVGIEPSNGLSLRYGFVSSATGERAISGWTPTGKPIAPVTPVSYTRFDNLVIEARDAGDPETIESTYYALDKTRYDIGHTLAPSPDASGAPFTVIIPGLNREPYDLNGKHYTVSWLGKQTELHVLNSGPRTTAAIELALGIAVTPHTAVLSNGSAWTAPSVVVRPKFWESGLQAVRFPITLMSGENRFTLSSDEPADVLPDGRLVCFLLVGEPLVRLR